MRETPDERFIVTAYRTKMTAVTVMLLVSSTAVTSVWAQSTNDPGGVLLRLGLNLGLEAKSNSTLSTADPGSTTEAFADLSLGLSSETRRQKLSFGLAGRLRGVQAPDRLALDQGFVNPSADLNYRLSGATSQLTLSTKVSESDLSDQTLFLDDDGSFDIVTGDAVRRNSTVKTRLEWNNDARVRYGAFGNYTDTRYSGGTALGIDGDTLVDTQRLTLGVDATLDLTTAAQLETLLEYSVLSEDGASGDQQTWTFDNTLTFNRPAGDIVFNFGVTDTEDGTRLSAAAGRSYLLPQVTLFGQLGVSEQVSGGVTPTAAFFAVYPLPRGGLSFGLSRAVSSLNIQDEERVNTRVDISYKQALSPLSDVNVDLLWAKAKDTDSEEAFVDGSLSVTFNRTLTKDWDMNLGVRHRYSDKGLSGSARSNELFINLNRSFLTRF